MTPASIIRNAWYWVSGMNIDADGSPHAYHPNSKLGLDNLANAGTPGNWYGLVCDAHGQPYVQGFAANGPATGFYLSATSLQDRNFPTNDARRYVDSETVPYIAVPRELIKTGGVKLGDVCMVFYNGQQCAAIVADVGPKGKYGEGSIALAKALGINPSARNGGVSNTDKVSFLVFLGSSKGWPRSREDIETQADELYGAWYNLQQ